MQTSALALELIRTAEGFEPSAYICPAGQVTIGYGNTCWEDGEPVHLGDEIDEAGATQLLWSYVRNEVEPALDRLIKVPLEIHQRDAFADFIFNFGEEKARGYTLTRLINEQAPTADICDWWVKYRVAAGKPLLGLYRRRLAEVLMWNNLPIDKAWTATMATTWRSLVGVPEYTPVKPEPKPAPEPKPVEAKVPRTLTLPDEWDTMTGAQQTAWLNTGEYIRIGGKMEEIDKPKTPATVAIVKKVIDTPNLKPDAPAKPMEQSQTHRGLSKADSGKEAAIISTTVLGGVAYSVPHAEKITGYIEKYPPSTIFMVLGILAGLGVLYGLWRWWAGQMIAEDGRRNAEGPKL